MKLLRSLNTVPPSYQVGRSSVVEKNKVATKPVNNFSFTQNGLECLGVYNKANISFKGYYGDKQPAKKLFWIATGRNEIYRDEETEKNAWRVDGQKKWSTMLPSDLLKRTPEQAIQSICTLNDTYYIPDCILSPNYGMEWGRRANYIEFNPRLLAKAEGNQKSEGLLNMIKLLPAIPPSSKSYPNCIILSQLFPTYGSYNDGYTGDQSLYSINLSAGISKNLTSRNLERNGQRMGDDEQVKAFDSINFAIEHNEHIEALLYGVTGSGKTEIYLQLI